MSPSESKWIQVNPRETKWVQVKPGESKWVQVSPSESIWVHVNLSESKWVKVSPSGFKWVQTSPSEIEVNQVSPSETPPPNQPPIQLELALSVKNIGLGSHGHVHKSENHENDGFSGFPKMDPKSCQSRMTQNISTELISHSFKTNLHKSGTQDSHRSQILILSWFQRIFYRPWPNWNASNVCSILKCWSVCKR